jgi:predicted lipid-binding transport protein (Tim44 family)
MSDSGTWIEIVLLAMLAGFIGLRLVSVLGRRTGHEKPAGEPFRAGAPELSKPGSVPTDARAPVSIELPSGTPVALRADLQSIADADSRFEPARFLVGARAAYGMILEAFWAGNAADMKHLVSDEVLAQFSTAIDARSESGVRFENRLVGIDAATLVGAQMVGQMAEVTVRFDAQIAGVSTDASGAVVAGSKSDATPTHDVWTFSHHVSSADPAWLLIATDDGE